MLQDVPTSITTDELQSLIDLEQGEAINVFVNKLDGKQKGKFRDTSLQIIVDTLPIIFIIFSNRNSIKRNS